MFQRHLFRRLQFERLSVQRNISSSCNGGFFSFASVCVRMFPEYLMVILYWMADVARSKVRHWAPILMLHLSKIPTVQFHPPPPNPPCSLSKMVTKRLFRDQYCLCFFSRNCPAWSWISSPCCKICSCPKHRTNFQIFGWGPWNIDWIPLCHLSSLLLVLGIPSVALSLTFHIFNSNFARLLPLPCTPCWSSDVHMFLQNSNDT